MFGILPDREGVVHRARSFAARGFALDFSPPDAMASLPSTRRWIRNCAIAALAAALPLAGASAPLPLHAVATDATEFGSLRMDPFEAVAVGEGEWVVLFSAAYFNQWNGSWHTRRLHQELGRVGQPIGDDELRILEEGFPDDVIYRFDLEGIRADLMVARGFGRGVVVQLRVPWIEIGHPHWDGLADAFHKAFPITNHEGREDFPRGLTFLYLHTGDRSVTAREAIEGGGVGDVAFSISVPAGDAFGLSHRLAVAADLPTGDEATLLGSGGVDGGLRWFASRKRERSEWLIGAGFTRLARDGSFLGFERSDTAHFGVDYLRRITARTWVHAGGRLDTSHLAWIDTTDLHDPGVYYRIGIQRELGPARAISIELGEELFPQSGIDADFTIHLAWSVRAE